MIRRYVAGFSSLISDFLNRPFRVLLACLLLVFIGLVLDGTLLRLWGLHRDSQDLEQRMSKIEEMTDQLNFKIKLAQDPSFIELQARDRFELVEEGDLIFVFSDN